MSSKITLLPDHVVNQIAAGEVIENPSSVVKELVDNAIDAGARRIAIEILAGGQQSIKIEDDGCGMNRADLELCLLRHATSKLKEVADLDILRTMGFRGEALAAIASISKLEIRTSDGMEGSKLLSEGGTILSIESCARNRGTTIEANALFFNAPARRKFQKSPQANASQVMRTVQGLALAHPGIAFTLSSQGRILLQAESPQWKERVQEILGAEFCEQGIWFEVSGIRGLLGSADAARTTRLGQHFFLNCRPIFSPVLAKAVRAGYGTRVAEGTHPALVLFLEKEPTEFDVNVHPQKREVRFRDEAALFREIRVAVERAHLPSSMPLSIPNLVFTQPAPPFSFREEPPEEKIFRRTAEIQEQQVLQEALWYDEPVKRPLRLVGSFLLAESGQDLVLVDLREASVQKMLESNDRQSLLWPVEISLSLEEAERMDEILQRCTAVGVEARAVGPRQLCLDAIPCWLEAEGAVSFFTSLKEDLWQGISSEETLLRFCRNVEKRFTLEEAEMLWKQKAPREMKLESADLERLLTRKG